MVPKKDLRIGITGGPATGKTTLLEILRELGYPVFSADERVRAYLAPGGQAYAAVRSLCPEALREDGTLDRRILLRRLLQDPAFRARMEGLLHPLVRRDLMTFMEKHRGAGPVFAEIPLLFEAGWEDLFDEIWVVTCSEEIQRRRLRERLRDEELVRGLLRLQLPLAEKERRAHRVFSSEVPVEELRVRVQKVLSRSLRPSGESP